MQGDTVPVLQNHFEKAFLTQKVVMLISLKNRITLKNYIQNLFPLRII